MHSGLMHSPGEVLEFLQPGVWILGTDCPHKPHQSSFLISSVIVVHHIQAWGNMRIK